MPRVTVGVLALLVGVLIGWTLGHVRRGAGAELDRIALILERQQARAAETAAAYGAQGTREALLRHLDALVTLRDVISVSRYPDGGDPERYRVAPELRDLLEELRGCSHTAPERGEWRNLYVRAYWQEPEQ